MAGALVWALLSVGAGCLVAAQGPINGLLGRGLGSPIAAVLVSVSVSTVLTSAILLVSGQAPNWREPPAWLYLGGGCLGVAIVLAGVTLTHKLGAASFTAFLIFGQLAAGLLFDHFGAFGLERHEASLGRIGAVLCVLLGAVLLKIF